MVRQRKSFSNGKHYQNWRPAASGWRCSMSRIMTANSNQLCLVPSDPGCWLPLDHTVRFFDEIVDKELSLSRFVGNLVNSSFRGLPSYDLVMLLTIGLY